MSSDCCCCCYFTPTQEVTLKDNELTALRKQIEREFLEKIKVEDNIMEKMRSQLTLDKAAQYTKKMTDKLRKRATELVRTYIGVFVSLSYIHFEITGDTQQSDLFPNCTAFCSKSHHFPNHSGWFETT